MKKLHINIFFCLRFAFTFCHTCIYESKGIKSKKAVSFHEVSPFQNEEQNPSPQTQAQGTILK